MEKNNCRRHEIMAPVGCRESLAAAIQAGADSVYFGVEGLNMRAGSSANFTLADLRDIVRRCRFYGIKTYLTVNTIIYDSEMERLRAVMDAAADAGVTAVIASDVAAMTCARRRGIEVHLSTQLNLSNVEAVRFYAQFADVAVLARELNLQQVDYIHKKILEENITGPSGRPMRIEMFAHGALCMAVSGKCYLSLHEYNRSANRGQCNQVCRHAYTVIDRERDAQLDIENQYIMSPKDLKTIHFLNKMVDAGVEIFKIEGRARGPEYVKTVVACYREALDAIADGTYGDEKIRAWDDRLACVFNRGFWDGYYLGQRLGEWNHRYGSVARERKEYCAKTLGYYPRVGVGYFQCEAGELRVGDKLLIIGPTTGVLEVTPQELLVDDLPADVARKGDRFTMPVPAKVRPADRIYRLVAE